MTTFRYIGTKRRAKEHPRFVSGRGRFVADVALPGMKHVALVASPIGAWLSIRTQPQVLMKILAAVVCWFVYSFELFAARRIGWGGRRAAYLSALGFAIVLLNLVPISYFLTRSHNF